MFGCTITHGNKSLDQPILNALKSVQVVTVPIVTVSMYELAINFLLTFLFREEKEKILNRLRRLVVLLPYVNLIVLVLPYMACASEAHVISPSLVISPLVILMMM